MSHADLNMYATLGSGATTKAAPTAATDGAAIPQGVNQALILLKSTAGSGTMTASVRLWGYSQTSAVWHMLGTGTGAGASNTAGLLNTGSPIEESPTANTLRHAELINGLLRFDRIDYEIVSLGGSGTAVSVYAEFIPTAKVQS